jgi:hypothetical protein
MPSVRFSTEKATIVMPLQTNLLGRPFWHADRSIRRAVDDQLREGELTLPPRREAGRS